MVVKPFNNKPEIDKVKITNSLLNSITQEQMKELANIDAYERNITIFPASSSLKSNTDDFPEDYVLIENKTIHDKTPLAYDYFYNDIDKSYISSRFLFAKSASNRVDDELYLLYGYSYGYGVRKSDHKIQWLNYGISILDKVNSFEPSKNITYVFDEKSYFDDNCEYLGSIFPNIYNEDHYEILTKDRYKLNMNEVDTKYQLKDLIDNHTKVKVVNSKAIYVNDFETEVDFFSLDSFTDICFLSLYFQINQIELIYHTKNGLNFNSIIRDINCYYDKNKVDTITFLRIIEKKIKKVLTLYRTTSDTDSEYCLMFYSNDTHYGIEIIEEKTGRKVKIKMNKGEMFERFISNFYMRTEIMRNLNQSLLSYKLDKYYEKHGHYEDYTDSENDYYKMDDFKNKPLEYLNFK